MKNYIYLIVLGCIHLGTNTVRGQFTSVEKDSIYIDQIENKKNPDKVLHAEPLYIDLIRDLGARKGEREWNLGLGLSDNLNYDSYEALIEYEWAPLNRLGFEVELPFIVYSGYRQESDNLKPESGLKSLKFATQYSFYVNEKNAMSAALGYIHEFEIAHLTKQADGFFKGNVYNPFLVVAKRWTNNIHSLIYTGPRIQQTLLTNSWNTSFDINTSFHYMISGTRNFLGVEVNQTIEAGLLSTVLRPQMRLGIAENLLVGIVTAVPLNRDNERLGTFARIIWEPKHK